MSPHGEVSLDGVVFALRDDDPVERAQAATLLGLSGNPMMVEYLMQTLAMDPDVTVRRSAAVALGNLRHPLAIQPLMMAISSPDSDLRSYAAEALAKIEAPEVVELLIVALQGGERMRRGALEALILVGDDRALAALRGLVLPEGSDLARLRRAAIAALETPELEVAPVLRDLLASNDVNVRRQAMEGLSTRGLAEFDTVLVALADSESVIRARAAEILGQFADPGALDPLIGLLGDPDALVRAAAARALAEVGDARAIVPLNTAIDALVSGDSSRREMLEALSRLTGALLP